MAVDWASVEKDYRTGIKTLRSIGESHGITHGAINKRAKRDGWTRDLAQKIRAKADELVSKQLVSKTVSKESRITENDVITANAHVVAAVSISQRNDIKRNRELATKLMAELEATTDNLELFKQLGELLSSPDEKGMDKLGEIYRKVMSLPGRIKAMKELADTLRILIELERKVYKMEDAPSDNPLADLLKRVYGNSLPIASAIEGEYEEVDG